MAGPISKVGHLEQRQVMSENDISILECLIRKVNQYVIWNARGYRSLEFPALQ